MFVVQGPHIDTIAITTDGKRLLASHDSGSKVTTFGITDESDDPSRVELTMAGETLLQSGKAFSPDGTLLATSATKDSDRDLLVWNTATQQIVKSVKTGVSKIHSAVFSRDGRFLVCGCADGVAVFDRQKDWATTVLGGEVILSVAPECRQPADGHDRRSARPDQAMELPVEPRNRRLDGREHDPGDPGGVQR